MCTGGFILYLVVVQHARVGVLSEGVSCEGRVFGISREGDGYFILSQNPAPGDNTQ